MSAATAAFLVCHSVCRCNAWASLPRLVSGALADRLAVMPAVVVTLDDFDVLDAARRDREALVGGHEPITLDEVQREPGLLSSVKRAIDRNRSAGRFLLTGSANLLLMRQVSESLAARAIWFDGYVRTYLERDLQDLATISSLPDFRRLMQAACLRLGQLLNQTELGRHRHRSAPGRIGTARFPSRKPGAARPAGVARRARRSGGAGVLAHDHRRGGGFCYRGREQAAADRTQGDGLAAAGGVVVAIALTMPLQIQSVVCASPYVAAATAP